MFRNLFDIARAKVRQAMYDDLVTHTRNYQEHLRPDHLDQGNYLDDRGHERPDPTPMEPPLGYVEGPTLFETIQAMVRRANDEMKAEGSPYETEEEANDFGREFDDDYEPTSGYELLEEEVPISRGGGGVEPPSDEPPTPAKPAEVTSPQAVATAGEAPKA